MRYLRRLTLLFLLWPFLAQAQTTSVSGTITDAGAQSWNYGSFSFFFVPSPVNPQGPYRWNGAPFNVNQVISGSLDATGSFASALVPSNTFIFPSGSGWRLQVCPAATTACSSVVLTISGASQSVTSSITPPAIVLNLGNPPPGAAAYSDSEVQGAKPGSFYYNINGNTLHMCSITSFPPCTWLAFNGSTITSFSAGNLSPLFTTAVATPTTTPALSFSLSNAAAGTIYGNPTGAPAAPAFFTPASFPGVGSVTSFSAGTANPFFTTSVANPTTTPALTFNVTAQSANCVFAGPTSAGPSTPTCRALVGADLPNPGPTLGTGKGGVNSHAAVTHQFLTQIGTDGSVLGAQPTTGDISGLSGLTQYESMTFCPAGCDVTGTPCSTTNSANATCTNAITWPTAFADANYSVSCTGIGITQFPYIAGATKTASAVTVTTSNGSAGAAQISSYAEIDCQGGHR